MGERDKGGDIRLPFLKFPAPDASSCEASFFICFGEEHGEQVLRRNIRQEKGGVSNKGQHQEL